MLEEIDHQYLLYLGFDGADVADPERTLRQLRRGGEQVALQLLKLGLVAGPEHLRYAARNALHSFKGERRRSKSLAVEYLLYLSCQRQISKAIAFMGIQPSDRQIILVALSESKTALERLAREAPSLIGGKVDASLIESTSKRKLVDLQHAYGVSKKEMEAARFSGETDEQVVKRLIVERSALLDLED